ncbi:MAG: class I SAM-dependent methyltransferase [Euryarchaeota archaeon]|nr:class I SAM-dependent methyltransferase [Euryarchaeota archaeon]MDE2045133.1 class I SAM-dependent methyltransferase [Thermoplasmata archaeon]
MGRAFELGGVATRSILRNPGKLGCLFSSADQELVLTGATYAPWRADEPFLRVWESIRESTMVDRYRCYDLWQLVAETAQLSGVFLEVGVFRGGTGALIAARARSLGIDETVYLCDTFRGLVKAGAPDAFHRDGDFANTSEAGVEHLLASMGVSNVKVLVGIFPDETGHLIQPARVRFCHIDVDTYESAKGVFEWVWPRLARGAVVVFDDYGFRSTPGVTRFVNTLRQGSGRVVLHNLNGHAVVVRVDP